MPGMGAECGGRGFWSSAEVDGGRDRVRAKKVEMVEECMVNARDVEG
jgi:hypothetical protein